MCIADTECEGFTFSPDNFWGDETTCSLVSGYPNGTAANVVGHSWARSAGVEVTAYQVKRGTGNFVRAGVSTDMETEPLEPTTVLQDGSALTFQVFDGVQRTSCQRTVYLISCYDVDIDALAPAGGPFSGLDGSVAVEIR